MLGAATLLGLDLARHSAEPVDNRLDLLAGLCPLDAQHGTLHLTTCFASSSKHMGAHLTGGDGSLATVTLHGPRIDGRLAAHDCQPFEVALRIQQHHGRGRGVLGVSDQRPDPGGPAHVPPRSAVQVGADDGAGRVDEIALRARECGWQMVVLLLAFIVGVVEVWVVIAGVVLRLLLLLLLRRRLRPVGCGVRRLSQQWRDSGPERMTIHTAACLTGISQGGEVRLEAPRQLIEADALMGAGGVVMLPCEGAGQSSR